MVGEGEGEGFSRKWGGPLGLIATADLVGGEEHRATQWGRGLWRLPGEGARRLLGERMMHLEEKMEVTVGVGRWVSALVTEAGVLKGFGSIGIRQKG